MRTYHLDASGHVVELFDERPLALDDCVGPRPGVVYRMHPAEDSVRINFGARSITFPGFFRDAVDFALSMPAFAIR